MDNLIKVRGARQHNLKISTWIFPRKNWWFSPACPAPAKAPWLLTRFTPKASAAYVESLSSYARQFLGLMTKPDVDSLSGLSPAIAIDQKTTSRNPRSTVGTITEIYDYLRLLYARAGRPHCHHCAREISPQTIDQIVNQIKNLIVESLVGQKPSRFMILSPIIQDKKASLPNYSKV